MKKTLLVSGIALDLSSNVFAASDARSVGMGGVGVATADYLSAPVHNPALAAKYKEIDDVGLSPFDTFHIDVSGSYGGDSQYGAAIDLAFMF